MIFSLLEQKWIESINGKFHPISTKIHRPDALLRNNDKPSAIGNLRKSPLVVGFFYP